MNWWESLLLGFGYFFGAGFAARFWREGKEYNGESIFMGVFWPVILVIATFWGIIMLPVWLGIKAYELPAWKKNKTKKQQQAAQQAKLERDQRIKELEAETGIGNDERDQTTLHRRNPGRTCSRNGPNRSRTDE